MEVILGGNHFKKEESELKDLVRRPEIISYNALINHDLNSHSNSSENEIRD